ncbi:alanyl-tRNA synthetase, partial [mine drainage metagenome]
DITHYRALTREELHRVERRVNAVVREDLPVKSYFESRNEAERRFGFTLYQGGAVPGKELRIIEVPGFDVEACGGTHCTHTSEVGAVAVLDVERIQDGVVRLTYVSGERALDVRDEHEAILAEAARRLGVPPNQLPQGIDRLLGEIEAGRRAAKARTREDLGQTAARLLADPAATFSVGAVSVTAAQVALDRAGLKELSRLLTHAPGRVAILAAEQDGQGLLFVGSTAPSLSAKRLLEAGTPAFGGRAAGRRRGDRRREPGAPLAA